MQRAVMGKSQIKSQITNYFGPNLKSKSNQITILIIFTSGYTTWFTAWCAIHIAHYDVIDDVITRKL